MPVLTQAGDSFVYEAGKIIPERQPYNQADRSFQNSIQDTAGDETRAGKPRNLGGVLHSEGRFFHDLQTLVRYSHNQSWPDLVKPVSTTLPRSKQQTSQSFKASTAVLSLRDTMPGFAKHIAPETNHPMPKDLSACRSDISTKVTLSNSGVAGRTAGCIETTGLGDRRKASDW